MTRWIRLGKKLFGKEIPKNPVLEELFDDYIKKATTTYNTEAFLKYLRGSIDSINPEDFLSAVHNYYNYERTKANAETKNRRQGVRRDKTTKTTDFRI